MNDNPGDSPGDSMKHSEAPIRIYKKPNGKEVLWTDDENPPWIEAVPVGQIMDKPLSNWKLVRGFSNYKSFLSWLTNNPSQKPNAAMRAWLAQKDQE